MRKLKQIPNGPIPTVQNVIAMAFITGKTMRNGEFIANRTDVLKKLMELNFKRVNAQVAIDDALQSGLAVLRKDGRIRIILSN